MFVLDTNVCIGMTSGRAPAALACLQSERAKGALIALPMIVVHELWFGVEGSARPAQNAAALSSFLADFSLLDFDQADARTAASIRADLRRKGTPIGPYDVLIAGQALARGATLVTANTTEFSRVAGLSWEDWAIP